MARSVFYYHLKHLKSKGVSRNFVGIIFYTRKVLAYLRIMKNDYLNMLSQPRVAGSDIRLLSYLWS